MARGIRKWSKTAASNGNADSGVNWAEGQSPSSLNDSSRAEMASAAMWRDDNNGSLVGTLATATYSVTSNQTFDAYAAGDTIAFQLGSAMPATALVNVDSLGAKPLRPTAGTDFAGGEYVANQVIRATYFSSNSGEWIVTGSISNASLPIHNQTAESAQSTSDELPVYSNADSANRKVTVANLLKNVNGLTEDTSPDAAADFLLAYDTSATAAKKVKPQNLPVVLPRGYIDGCTLVYNTGDLLNINEGVCRDSTNTVNIDCPALTAKDLASTWVAGGSAGIRATGAIANQTYHIWAGRTAASSTADYYAHSSASAATVLTAWQGDGGSSYAYIRRIGSIVRTSGSIKAFVQNGDDVVWSSPALDMNAVANSASAVLRALTVPVGIIVTAKLMVTIPGSASSNGVLISWPNSPDVAPGDDNAGPNTVRSGSSHFEKVFCDIKTDTSGQVRHRAENANATLTAWTFSYKDSRGKDA